jgi:hypothetical protein
MMKLYTLIAAMGISFLSYGQVYLSEDFSGGSMPPTGWTLDGQPAQWSNSASNKAGGIAPEAKFTYKQVVSTSRLVSPAIDMTGVSAPVTLIFKHMYDWYANGPKIGVAKRFGTGAWTTVWEQTPSGNVGPETVVLTLSGIGQADFQFCFYITGNLYNVDYWFIDDINFYIPWSLDAKLASIVLPSYTKIGTDFSLKGKIENIGSTPITSFDVSYTVDGGAPEVYPVTGLDIPLGGSYDFTHGTSINLSETGTHEIVTTVENVNGTVDQDMTNNTLSGNVGVVPFIPLKKVIGEEATGTWCGWCVRGICYMDYMKETYPETWIGVAVHNGDPMTNDVYDNEIPSIIPNFPGYPSGTIDRSGANFYDPEEFEAGYLERINAISPGTLNLTNFTWDPGTRMVSFDVESEFVVDVTNELRFGAIITEDSLYGTTAGWAQTNYYAGGGQGPMCGFESLPATIPASQMVYNHVAREILNTPYGTVGSIEAPVLAGSIKSYNYTYNIPAEWNYDKLTFIGILLDAQTGEILNSNSLMTTFVGTGEIDPAATVSVFPNPSSNFANIVFSLKNQEVVKLAVYNPSGRMVYSEDAKSFNPGENKIRIRNENLSNGLYIVKLTVGNQTYTQKITVVK